MYYPRFVYSFFRYELEFPDKEREQYDHLKQTLREKRQALDEEGWVKKLSTPEGVRFLF